MRLVKGLRIAKARARQAGADVPAPTSIPRRGSGTTGRPPCDADPSGSSSPPGRTEPIHLVHHRR